MLFLWMLGGSAAALLTTLPLAWKWQLGLGRVAPVMCGLVLLSTATTTWLARFVVLGVEQAAVAAWASSLAMAFSLLAYRFYRDPERRPPNGSDVVVSPADGTVIYIYESRGGMLPVSRKNGHTYSLSELTKTPFCTEDAVVVGISMSFLYVHVNRAPIAGEVILKRHFPGGFGSLRQPDRIFDNERFTTVIKHHDFQVAMIQIASRLVRQIASFVEEGQQVALGQRIGLIRFGSQVDLVLPTRDDMKVAVRVGEHVKAGESHLATIPCCSQQCQQIAVDWLPGANSRIIGKHIVSR